ncbi:MAG: hypothetical protein ACRC4T_24865 [Cetobacterium sp.]
MTKEQIESCLLNMENQCVFEITGKTAKKATYFKLYFLKLNNNKFLACDILAGFLIGTIIEENYMTIERTIKMIQEYFQDGYSFEKIFNPNFPKIVE